MFWHVWRRACLCPQLASVTLATDDERIAEAAARLGVPWVMTSSEHESGTDRVYEAARLLGLPTDAVLVNIQGDEPALAPAMLGELVQPFFVDPAVRVSTLVRRSSLELGEAAEANSPDRVKIEADSPDRVKVVFARNGDALYFSRAAIPFERDVVRPKQSGGGIHYLHIGLYAFRYEALAAFTALPKSRLEGLEKLEQLRFLENGIPIRVVLTEGRSLGVDRPEDLPEVLRVMAASEI